MSSVNQINRVVHLTLHKCGSQWVRDVLCAPEIVACSGLPNSGMTLHFQIQGGLQLPEQRFSGPIYGMNRWEWMHWKQPGDRAVVVLRDPRDRLVSNLFSVLYSHAPDPGLDMVRQLLHSLPEQQSRVTFLIYQEQWRLRVYHTWLTATPSADAWVLRYESLVADQHGEFARILDWLGWRVPADTLQQVVQRLSFETRSGRQRGDTDKFSHYRSGTPGDWRNHFTRAHGELWERLYPGFLREIGYETQDDWWQDLPERQSTSDDYTTLVAVLERKQHQLSQQLEEKEAVIQELLLERETRARDERSRDEPEHALASDDDTAQRQVHQRLQPQIDQFKQLQVEKEADIQRLLQARDARAEGRSNAWLGGVLSWLKR